MRSRQCAKLSNLLSLEYTFNSVSRCFFFTIHISLKAIGSLVALIVFIITEPWPFSRTQRLAVDRTAKEKLYHGPNNKILASVFNDPRYEISPQAWPLKNKTAIEYAIEYLVQIEDEVPVPRLEIKRASDINFAERRSAADEQIRDRFRELAPYIRTPRFYMVSAIGTQCCVYTYERDANGITITPPAIHPTNHRVTEDLGTLACRNRFNEYFDDVKNMCNQL